MGRFALLGLLLTGTALALAPGAGGGGGPAGPEAGDPPAVSRGGDAAAAAVSGDSVAPTAGEHLVLAVIGTERSASAVHGERAVVADPHTGELDTFVLPGGTLCHGPLMAVGDRVVFSGYRGSKAFAMSLPLTLSGEPTPLGRADTITPSPRSGRVWLGQWDHAGKRSRAALREVAVLGEKAASRAAVGSGSPEGDLPREAGAWPASGARIAGPLPGRWNHFHAALPGGFVIETRRGLALWDGRAARPLRGGRRAWPVASGGPRLAWCSGRCRSVRVRTPSGERVFRSPPHLRPNGSSGSFSPDGRRLAVPVAEGRRTRAVVLDLRTGEWSDVPGGALSVYGALAWSTAADRLYLASRGGGLRAWRPGAPRSEPLSVDPGGTVMSISVAP